MQALSTWALHKAVVRPGMFLAQWWYLLVVNLDTRAAVQVLKGPSVNALGDVGV